MSDAVPLRVSLERELHPRVTWNPELSARSMQEVRRIRDGDAGVMFGHDLEQWSTLRTGADSYR